MAREYFKNLPDRTTPVTGQRMNGLLNGEESIEKIVAGSIEGKNLFDKSDNITLDKSYTASGAITTTSDSFIQESYIKVKPNTKYTLSANNVSVFRFCEYASDKSFVIRQTSITSPATFTTGSTTQYIRVSGNTVGLDTFQIELGENATEYDKFNRYGYNSEESMGNIVVDDIENKNLNDGTTSFNGYLSSDGTENSSSGWRATKYIPIEPNTTYISSFPIGSAGGNPSRCYYDSSKTFISGFAHSARSNYADTSPSNASYMRESVATESVNDLKITKKEFDSTAYILWQNPDATSDFASQTITTSDDIRNYKYYEMLFCYNKNATSRIFSTGKIPTQYTSGIFIPAQYNYRRYVNVSSSTVSVQDCVYYATYGSTTTTTANTHAIPVMLLAYK